MMLKQVTFDKNYHDDDAMCIGCGGEFDSFETLFELGSVIDGYTQLICYDCAEKMFKYLSGAFVPKNIRNMTELKEMEK